MKIVLLMLTLMLVSCVGVLETTKKPIDKSVKTPTNKLTFAGAEYGAGIAHDKIRISFKPATGAERITYLAYMSGNYSISKGSLSWSEAVVDSKGYLHIVVTGLELGTKYSFTVRAFDENLQEEDTNTKKIIVSTLDYQVPLFDGISKIENVAGTPGKTSLTLFWTKAQPSSTPTDVFGTNPYAITSYIIYVGESEDTLEVFSSVAADTSDPTEIQTTIDGLEAGKTYFVRVRAQDGQTPARMDENYNTLSKTTNTDGPIVFAGIKAASIPSTDAGLTSANITWEMGTGNFDRYRIFVSSTEKSSFNPAIDSGYGSDVTNLALTSTTITGLPAFTKFYVAVVACDGASCSNYQGNDLVKTVTTTPPIAPFAGIKTITQPASVEGLTTAIITWDLPNTNLGIYDEIKVFRSSRNGVYDVIVDELLPYDELNPTVIGYDLAEYSPTSRTIKGLETDTEYCFVAKAYSNGKTHTNQSVSCITPSYQSPVFIGADTACQNTTSKGFKITWSTPNPLGVFSSYNIYVKTGSSGFNFNNAIAGDPEYTKFGVATTQNSYTFTTLVPSSTYQVGVRTYFKHPLTNDEYYDTNQKIITCLTQATTAITQGWTEVMAVGPKIDGITGGVVLERIKPRTEPDYLYPVFQDTDDPARNLNRGIIGVPGISASSTGIVYLAWNDFGLSGTADHMYDFKDDADSGYNIYRLPWKSDYDTAPPTWSDPAWTKLNSSLIKPLRGVNGNDGSYEDFGEYIDYSVNISHLTDTAKIYFYKVEAVLNGQAIALSTEPGETFSDSIIKIVLPPKNMALVHRWMANLENCTRINREVDRNNHYRCLYNGLASKDGYFDFGGHVLVDRFEMGCNFTRGGKANPDDQCSVNGGSTSTAFEGGADIPSKGIKQGDCIGSGAYANQNKPHINADGTAATGIDYTGLIRARSGSIFYSRYKHVVSCQFNNTGGLNSGAVGTSWAGVYNALESDATAPSSSILPINSVETPMGTGYGAVVATNNANMPTLDAPSQDLAFKLCMAHKVVWKSKTYQKKLPRKYEYHTISAFNHLISANNLGEKIAADTLTSGLPDKDCLSTNYRSMGIYTLDLFKPQYSTTNYNHPYQNRITSGSQGDNSTENCVTRFGLQDIHGNEYEFFSDQIWCNTTSCSYGYKDSAKTDPFNPPLDPDIKNIMRNGDGEYMNWDSANSFGVPATITGNLNGNAAALYFNPIVGMPLACAGTACSSAGDDNVLISLKTEALTGNPMTERFSYPLNSDWIEGIASGIATYPNRIYHSFGGGGYGGGGSNGLWIQYLRGTVGYYGFRCVVRLPEVNGVIP